MTATTDMTPETPPESSSPAALDATTKKALERRFPGLDPSSRVDYEAALEQLAVDATKALCADMVQHANSGHPGGPMSSADYAYVLFADFLRASHNGLWPDRDRFLLSGGHMSTLLYCLLHYQGHLSKEDLRNFRQLGSPAQGHPVAGFAPGIETTTGPLGQGFANGVGMAVAEKLLRNAFGPECVDHRIHVLATDGDVQEGICHEAAALAGLLGLDHLIVFYDSNDIQLASSTAKTMSEDVAAQFAAMRWRVLTVPDGHDRTALRKALSEAVVPDGRPTMIIGKTIIANGTSKAGLVETHGSPLGAECIADFKRSHGLPEDKTFWVPDFVYEVFQRSLSAGDEAEEQWNRRFQHFRAADPQKAASWDMAWEETPSQATRAIVDKALDAVSFEPGTSVATRSACGKFMGALAPSLTQMAGGSADLANSTKTDGFEKVAGYLVDGLEEGTFEGRGIHFGVREHAMGGIANGMALHGGLLPYTGTFLVFSDYMRGSIRLAAISHARVVFIFTHDSIYLGEDGETHQPVEHLAALRAIPNLVVFRPADANEMREIWRHVLSRPAGDGPVAFALTRQNVPVLPETAAGARDGISRGGYLLRPAAGGSPPAEGEDAPPADVQILATGSEVSLALEVADRLESSNGLHVSVVSIPSLDRFLRQPPSVRDSVVDPRVPLRVSLELGVAQGWEALTGEMGLSISIDRFGQSAPWEDLAEHYGFTAGAVVSRILEARAGLRARLQERLARDQASLARLEASAPR